MSVRPQHLANAAESFKAGILGESHRPLRSSGRFHPPTTEQYEHSLNTRYNELVAVEGGATFSADQAKEDGTAKMNGSWLIFHAENMEKAREWLENDIYTTGGAWDMSKVEIYSIARAKH